MIEALALEIFQASHGGLTIAREWTRFFFKTLQELIFMHGNHYNQQNANKLARARSKHGILINLPREIVSHSSMPCGQ
jgi:hypothetical protein